MVWHSKTSRCFSSQQTKLGASLTRRNKIVLEARSIHILPSGSLVIGEDSKPYQGLASLILTGSRFDDPVQLVSRNQSAVKARISAHIHIRIIPLELPVNVFWLWAGCCSTPLP